MLLGLLHLRVDLVHVALDSGQLLCGVPSEGEGKKEEMRGRKTKLKSEIHHRESKELNYLLVGPTCQAFSRPSLGSRKRKGTEEIIRKLVIGEEGKSVQEIRRDCGGFT